MRKPNFFIIGFPKCGTTTLHAWLDAIPEVFMSQPKEPYYWNRNDRVNINSLSDYERLFEDANPNHQAIGEASVNIIYSKKAINKILKYNQKSRFIVLIRDPVELVFSLFAQRRLAGLEPIESIDDALQKSADVNGWLYFGTIDYLTFASQGYHLGIVLKLLDTKNIMIVYLNDLQENPEKTMASVLNFLNVESSGGSEYPVLNQARSVRSFRLRRAERWVYGRLERTVGVPDWLRKAAHALNRKPGRPPASPATRAWLRERLADDVVQLETLTGRDLTAWRETPPPESCPAASRVRPVATASSSATRSSTSRRGL